MAPFVASSRFLPPLFHPPFLDKRPFCFHDTRSKRDAQWEARACDSQPLVPRIRRLKQKISRRDLVNDDGIAVCVERQHLVRNILMITLFHMDGTLRWYQSYASHVCRELYRNCSPSPPIEEGWISIQSFSRDGISEIHTHFHDRWYNCDPRKLRKEEATLDERLLYPKGCARISPLSTSVILTSDFMILSECVYAFSRGIYSPLFSDSQRKPLDRVS